MKIGETIKTLRKKSRLSQIELSNELGITQTFLSHIENGKTSPRTDLIEKIAEKLKVPLTAIYLHSLEETDVDESKKGAFKIIHGSLKNFIEALQEDSSIKE